MTVGTLNVYMLILMMSNRKETLAYFTTKSNIMDIAAQAMVQLSTVWDIVYVVDSTTVTIWAIAFSLQTVKFY